MDKQKHIVDGYYVMLWGGGRYNSIAWYKHLAEANKHIQHLLMIGAWAGMPPTVEVSFKRM